MWNHVFSVIALKFDLIPEQIPFIPMGFNIIAAILGLPAVLRLILKPNTNRLSPANLVFLIVCSSTVVLLLVGTVRWAFSDSDSMMTGFLGTPVNSGSPSGDIDNGRYHNEDLRLSVNLPDNWIVLTSNAIRRAHVAGSQSISESGTRTLPNKLPEGIDQFLAIKKFPETHRGYNPSLAFVSYEKGAMRRSGCDSLNALISPLALSGPPFKLLSGPSVSKVGAFNSFEVRLDGDFPGVSIRQYIHGFETDTHYFTVTAAFQQMDDYAVMRKALRSLAKTK